MPDFDPDELPESYLGQTAAPRPSHRATYRAGRLTVLPFFSSMVAVGPTSNYFSARTKAGVVIADLTTHPSSPGDEVSVVYQAQGRHLADAEERLIEWAASVGFHRIWFPDRLVELAAIAGGEAVASVKCSTCGQRWSDGGTQFWDMIAEQHAFPTFCPLCGADLPQWRLEGKPDPIRRIPGDSWASDERAASKRDA